MPEAWKQWEGQVVNEEFHLRQYLGGSDHSAVFLTAHVHVPEGLERAAIKLIPAEPDNADLQLSRWSANAQLSHPRLLRLFRTGRCRLDSKDLLYVLMEYADEDLSQILPQRALTPEEAREMLKPVLEALAFLHGKGFVHGHIKPANIMAREDQIKLSSDGLRPAGESQGRLAKLSAYDPPESAAGDFSPAGDVWALGVTLVEALTQRLPVWEPAKEQELAVPPTLRAPFFEIARNCLRSDPQHRWTVAQIAAQLQQAPLPVATVRVADRPRPQAQPAARPAPPRQAVPRSGPSSGRRYLIPTLAVALALAAILAGPRLFRRPANREAPPAASEQPATRPSVQSKAQSKSKQRPAKPEIRESVQKTEDQSPGLTGTASSPTPLLSEAKTTTAAGRVRGEVVRQVLPEASQKARDTIRGKVRVSVRVSVDPSGDIVDARFESPGPSKYFANLALEAAEQWEFRPAKVDGLEVASEWIVRFEFAQAATRAFPRQVSP